LEFLFFETNNSFCEKESFVFEKFLSLAMEAGFEWGLGFGFLFTLFLFFFYSERAVESPYM
jgi:hypothetical protein